MAVGRTDESIHQPISPECGSGVTGINDKAAGSACRAVPGPGPVRWSPGSRHCGAASVRSTHHSPSPIGPILSANAVEKPGGSHPRLKPN